MATFISHSPEETSALGEQWGREAKPGWLIGLMGDLGAGKTQLVKGFARGLGLAVRILSPTFALVNEHRGGRLPLAHLDLYRLETREEILGAGLDQYLLAPEGVTVVEWIERWLKGPPPDLPNPSRPFRLVRFEQSSETERQITYEDFGS
jgi:tRNA threonylcarbamoyladenosine biosynthesis protein TsaE